jgi:hypothetical protein
MFTPLTILLIATSAAWRLTSLLCNEAGPFGIFERLRNLADRLTKHNKFCASFRLSEGIHCEWCASIWIATPLTVAWYFLGNNIVWLCLPFAISTWVIFGKYVIQTLSRVQEIVDAKADEKATTHTKGE